MSDYWCIEIVKSPSYSKNVADVEYIIVQLCFFSEGFGWADESWDSQACKFFDSIFPLSMAWFRAVVSKVEGGASILESMWNNTRTWEKELELLLHLFLSFLVRSMECVLEYILQ